MEEQEFIVPNAGAAPSALTLPRPETPDALRRVGAVISHCLARRARDLAAQPGDAGAIEYASWLRLLQRPAP
jgi:hypothetical protein